MKKTKTKGGAKTPNIILIKLRPGIEVKAGNMIALDENGEGYVVGKINENSGGHS